MAYASESDSDYKLPLRPWLEKQIRNRRFKGLEWDDSAAGDEKLFRLPWAKKDYPGWEECYAIAKAWAQHQGREVSGAGDFSKLKANFRCNMNKSDDFEEIRSKSQLDNQTGNYKVYRFVPPDEVRDRKKSSRGHRAKKPRLDSSSMSVAKHNIDSHELKTLPAKDLDCFDEIACNTEISTSSSEQKVDLSHFLPGLGNEVLASPKFLETSHNFAQLSPVSRATFAIAPPTAGEYIGAVNTLPNAPSENMETYPTEALAPPSDSIFFGQNLVSPQGDLDRFQSLQIQPCDPCVQPYFDKCIAPISDMSMGSVASVHSSNAAAILAQLGYVGVEANDLKKCEMKIVYDTETVYDEKLPHLERGYLILHGDPDVQIGLLKMSDVSEERLDDYNCEKIQLPKAGSSARPELTATIRCAEFGLVVRYNPTTLCISVKRLCQSQVFYFDPHSKNEDEEPKKIERYESVDIFSHEKYVIDYMKSCVSPETQSAPVTSVWLTIGTRPKNIREVSSKRGIKIELVPFVLDFFNRASDSPNNSVSLYFSNATPLDELLRQFNQTSINGD